MLSLDFLDDVRRMNKRQLYYQVLNFGMIVSSALMIWKGLMVITGSESPIVVVLSGSMEPAFHRGDLLFLTNRVEDPIRVGEIVVFRIEGREIPIVHRVLKIHEKQNGHIKFLTKGDNNAVDDRGLYKQGQHWLEKKDVVGRARGTPCSFCWACLCWFIASKKPALPPLGRCRTFCYRMLGVDSGL
uniref:Signal peptidase complex catalytic subunit SEC11 n=1 Tax=Oryctolagus cuniculus TaxID=9986 RepID=A0A5F9DPR6_RABIT